MVDLLKFSALVIMPYNIQTEVCLILPSVVKVGWKKRLGVEKERGDGKKMQYNKGGRGRAESKRR